MIYAKNSERGNILISAMLVLVAINLMGIGLLNISLKESVVATHKAINSEVFQVTESCTRDAITWLESQTSPPTSLLPYTIDTVSLSDYTENDSVQIQTKLSTYSYTCVITDMGIATSTGSVSGVGTGIGVSSGYGIAAGDT
ncbi:hypothetical protein N9W34_07070, partial [Rickettsiales bacterium]|nr:hypothetical protein [Rickettsiales bacterium]